MSTLSAKAQLAFLEKIQRLFDEGEFTATYKFALMLTLTELAIERGTDDDAQLALPLDIVAERFMLLYWRQASTFGRATEDNKHGLLIQNLGKQAAVINRIRDIYHDVNGNPARAPGHRDWRKTVTSVRGIVHNMPLRHLQIIGGQNDRFLYDYPCLNKTLVLKRGVSHHLRRFSPLIQQLAKAGWIEHIRSNSRNASLLGKKDDLEAFMFGTPRAQLTKVAEDLTLRQNGRCFYCQKKLHDAVEVDHFIPWSRYPRDTAHNFVVAHRGCNNDKRDMLAAKKHLERWLERNDRCGHELGESLASHGFVADIGSSLEVARWAYGEAVRMQGIAWIAPRRQTEAIDPQYLAAFKC
ncbi:HNH endonuclease [Pseudohongiella spirulinae]|uniref:Endonuclease n=1 Tax=Pseudohongiella spirulinae TaxID=1249552 RepID=A0A0S2KHW2_9GAMM|nr:HNH endonuclease [Pseudohongiella spirulinae]ALO47620.1 endonuclease [Pseudohongiella spirulinae]